MDEKLVNIILHRFLRFLKKKELYSSFCKNVHLNNQIYKNYYKTVVTNIQIGNFMNIIGMAKYFTYEELVIYRALWCHYLINTPYLQSKLKPEVYKKLFNNIQILNQYHESTLLKYITDYSELDILRYCKMQR